ncbi:MAG TPA: hypothetical protein PLI44_00495 [Chiayiivirga sp.]|uniref:Uncharacterized protein n=1 Tax=Denitratimonas tolerans TaxID=1338420 RepID=A0AAW9R8C1_9GAMM|nr:hypothetical protein [Chiayiivirga sp.]MEB2316196.1 hypothetical protein [Xanthomonadaceae bacterium]HMN35165.1 hypothetical protein [Chiayiivirga sp.]HRN58717.1 hypothetical protein [Chiayiivirga sp.]HRP86520.1 hypothetical protein [Gammaproteobacteria bacterium]
MNPPIQDNDTQARRRGVRRTVVVTTVLVVLIYAAFVAGLIGR